MNIEKEHRTPGLQAQAMRLTQTIASSDTYRTARMSGESHIHALQATTDSLVESELPRGEKSLLLAMTKTGAYIDARTELDAINSAAEYRPLSQAEKQARRELKELHIIPFNHALKDFINEHPDETLNATVRTLTMSYQSLFAKHDALHGKAKQEYDIVKGSTVAHEIQESLEGMRHEIAAESLMAANEVDYYYDVSDSEDRKGTDLYFYNGTEWVAIDIKASDIGVHSSKKHGNYNAVSTGLSWTDFTGRKGTTPGALTISYDTALKKGPAFIEKLFEISEQQKQRNRAARVGRGTLQAVS